jgi:hypothetical protein
MADAYALANRDTDCSADGHQHAGAHANTHTAAGAATPSVIHG